jgi:hypothetical protein
MVPEEGCPGRVGSRSATQGAQVARDAALGDLEAEAQQLPVDAGRAPGVLHKPPPDESADFAREGRAAGALAAPGQPVPVDAEAGPVPTHDRAWPNCGKGLGPTAPEAAQQDPEEPIGGPDVGVSSTGQGGELLAQGQILDDDVTPRAQRRAERRQEGHRTTPCSRSRSRSECRIRQGAQRVARAGEHAGSGEALEGSRAASAKRRRARADLAPFRCRQVAVGPCLTAIRHAFPCTAVLTCFLSRSELLCGKRASRLSYLFTNRNASNPFSRSI